MLTDRNQRWRERREKFVPGSSLIDPRTFAVEPVRTNEAKGFIQRHHYLATYPVARFAAGLGAHTFLRPQQIISYDRDALAEVHEPLLAISAAEGLPAHGEAVSARFELER